MGTISDSQPKHVNDIGTEPHKKGENKLKLAQQRSKTEDDRHVRFTGIIINGEEFFPDRPSLIRLAVKS